MGGLRGADDKDPLPEGQMSFSIVSRVKDSVSPAAVEQRITEHLQYLGLKSMGVDKTHNFRKANPIDLGELAELELTYLADDNDLGVAVWLDRDMDAARWQQEWRHLDVELHTQASHPLTAGIDMLVGADDVVQHRCQRAVQDFIIRMLEQQTFLLQGIKPVFY